MPDIFISLPTQHGDARLVLEKAKLSAIVPVHAGASTLYYDGIAIEVLMSSKDLAEFLSNDPLFACEQVKHNWIGTLHEGYASTSYYFHSFADFGGERECDRDHWLAQFARIDVFQTPYFNKNTGKLTTQVKISAFLVAYAQDIYDQNGYRIPNSADYSIENTAAASFELELLMPANTKVTQEKIIKAFKKGCNEKAIAKGKTDNGLNIKTPRDQQIAHFFGTSNDYFIISEQFPAVEALISATEYDHRLNGFGSTIQASLDRQLALMHTQARVAASLHIADAIRYAGSAIQAGIVQGAYIVGSYTASGLSQLANQSHENARMRVGLPPSQRLGG